VLPGAEHVMEYHVVIDGYCWAALDGEPPLRLQAGDIVVFPQGDAHVISSAPHLRASATSALPEGIRMDRLPIHIAYEGTAPVAAPPGTVGKTTVVCGFLTCDLTPFNPLIASLPRMMHLAGGDRAPWIAQVVEQAVSESRGGQPGSDAMLARISEMLFVDAVRRHAQTLPEDGIGWLTGLRDRYVGRALALMHERAGDDWSLERLGEEVGLSRSALHERFMRFIGQAPMQYLAQWRMQVACGMLRQSQWNVAAIAQEVGYDSEAAFTRAFKRIVGQPPATWRRSHEREKKSAAMAI
jgi:AraC-like DNA-binding protein